MKLGGYRKAGTAFCGLQPARRALSKRGLLHVIPFLLIVAGAACAQTMRPASNPDDVLANKRISNFCPNYNSARSPQFNRSTKLKVRPSAQALVALGVNSCIVGSKFTRLGRIRYA
jgi:hypothetical protein